METGAARLAQWIERSRLNQLETAALIGIDPTYLSHILNGKRRPGLDNALKIEQTTGIAVEAWVATSEDESESVAATPSRKRQMDKA